ncbi:MAG: hypothetical protein JF597_18310 [Streptomyces sp.]|uniref:hypothetical protein n=1 Tax=Streptomyces sp. TaxID=1931 RepID=UPI0025FFD340|nr:hypothetical protein [Streptomyces sp.]MBW8795472.1 hypothetical protein [Streptomyces sp.]
MLPPGHARRVSTSPRTDLAVTVPYNTEAEIWVPTRGRPVTAPSGVTFVRDDTSGGAAYRVYRARAGS